MQWRICVLSSSIFMVIFVLNGICAYPDAIFSQGCDTGNKYCELICVFNATTENFNVTWQVNNLPPQNSTVTQDQKSWMYKSELTITNDAKSEGNYTCTAYNGDTSQTMTYSFVFNGNHSLPKILNSSYEIVGEGNCNVTFTCIIQATPPPTVEWIKIDLNNKSASILSGNTSSTKEMSSGYYLATVTITNYSQSDVGNYSCLAYNSYGIHIGDMLFPHVPPGFPEISEQSVTFKPGDVVSLNCTSSGGFPAPKISWNFNGEQANISERFLPVDNGVSVAYLDIHTNWSTDNVRVRCVVEDTVVPAEVKKSSFVFLYLTTTPYLVNARNCSVGDFDRFQSCSLTCEVYSPTFVSVQWIYSFDNVHFHAHDPYPLTNVSYPQRPFYKGPFRVSLNLTAGEYRNGQYECKFLSSAGDVSHVFQIDGMKLLGDSLGSRCTNKSVNNCGTWNSICYEPYNECSCPYDYPVPSENSYSYSSACLPVASPGTLCLTPRQCAAAEQNYDCFRQNSGQQYGICECRAPYFKVYIHETMTSQCIAKASYQSSCTYDAQCQLSDPFLECDDDYHECECVDGYYFSVSNNFCQYDTDSSSVGMSATTAIIVSISIFLIIVFVILLIFIRTKSMNRQRRIRRARREAAESDPWRPYTVPDVGVEGQNILPPYSTTDIAPPPSYHDAQRCETPPPPFDSIDGTKWDDGLQGPQAVSSSLQDLEVEQRSSIGIFHIYDNDHASTGFLNPAYEEDC